MKVVFSRGTAEILEMCGRGLFGKINRARIEDTGEIYACMEIDYSIISTEERTRLQQEIEILPQLVHKHVVRYLESVHDHKAKMSYLLMEHFTLGDLADVIRSYRREHSRIDEDRIWKIFAQLLIAMEYCHSVRKPNAIHVGSIVHRNIIPSNIFIGEGDLIKLGYFSLHQVLASNSFIRDAESPFYTAPEILQKLPYTEKADIWSLGCVIYELCTLQRPFIEQEGEGLADVIMRNEYEPVPSEYSQELRAVIDLMLSIDPNARPSATDLLGRPKFGAIGVHKAMLDAQSSDIDMLISNIKEKDISLARASEDIVELHKQVETLKGEAAEAEATISATEQQLRSTTEAFERAKEEHQKLITLYDKEVKASTESQLKLQEQTQQIDTLASTLEGLNSILIGHEGTIKELNKTLDDKVRHTGTLERKVSSLLAEKDAQKTTITNYECLLNSKDAELRELKDELEKLGHRVSAAEEEKSGMYLKIDELASNVARVSEQESQIETLSSKVVHLEESIASKEHDLQEATKRIASLISDLDQAHQHLATVESERSEIKKKCTDLSEQCEASLSENTHFAAKLESYEFLIADQKAQIREWSALISELKEKLHLVTSQFNHKLQECEEKTVTIAKLSELTDSLNIELSQALSELNSLKEANQIILQEKTERDLVLEETEKQLELEKSRSAWRSQGQAQSTNLANKYREYMRIPKLMIKSNPGDTPLMLAIIKNQSLEGLLKYAGSQDQYGRTALMRAAYYNNVTAVKLLVTIEGGMQDIDGNTALMFAVERENSTCVDILVSVEAGSLTTRGFTALMRAACNGSSQMVELLCNLEGGLATPEGLTALMLAALAEDASSVSLLLKRECGMLLLDGTSALLMATSTGSMDVIRPLFYSEGRIKDSLGRTPLMIAAEMGHLEAVRFLAPTQTGAVTTDGETALMMAALRGHAEVVQILYYREAGITRPDGWTSMMYAASFGYCSIVEILLRREGKLCTNRGWTALMSAVANNQFEVARLLAPVEGTIRDNSGKTALDQAREMNSTDMVAFLATALA